MRVQVEFSYKELGHDGKPLRTHGTMVKLDVDRAYPFEVSDAAITGRGETLKAAILDWLRQCELA